MTIATYFLGDEHIFTSLSLSNTHTWLNSCVTLVLKKTMCFHIDADTLSSHNFQSATTKEDPGVIFVQWLVA